MELSPDPFPLSKLIGKPVYDGSGRRLGRALELRAHWEEGSVVIDEVLFGRGSILKRLRGPGAKAQGVSWESVAEVGERIIVRV